MALIDSKTLEDLRNIQLQKWQELISNININSDSMVYMDASVLAELLYLMQQDTITLVNNAFIAYATADELTNLGADRGIPRLAGVNATGSVVFGRSAKASQDYVIPQGTLISTQPDTDGTSIKFSTDAEVTLYGIIAKPANLQSSQDSTGGSIGDDILYYKVTAVSEDGKETDATASVSENISTGTGTNKVNLTWDAVVGAASYNVYLSTDDVTFYQLATGITAASYEDTDADVGASTTEPPVSNGTGNLTVSADVTAALVGDDSNVAIGTVTNFITKPTGIETVTNSAAISGGVDEEDDETYRTRLKETLASNFGKVTVTGYKQTAESVTGVSEAFVVPNPAGGALANEITVYILSSTGTGVPDAALIALVQAELDKDENRAVCDDITVVAPSVNSIDVTVDITDYNSEFTQSEITAEIEAGIATYLKTIDLNGTVRLVDIEDVIHSVYAVNDFDVTTPVSNTSLGATEVAIPGTITVNFS